MTQIKRLCAVFLCFVFILAMLASSAFIVHGAGHSCTGERCPVCQMIYANSRLMRFLGAAVLVIALLFKVPCDRLLWRDTCCVSASFAGTLVKLKIRLDD